MTGTGAQPTQWTDERINARINDILAHNNHTPRGLARRISYEVRDELSEALAAAQARIASMSKAFEEQTIETVKRGQRIAELERELEEMQTLWNGVREVDKWRVPGAKGESDE